MGKTQQLSKSKSYFKLFFLIMSLLPIYSSYGINPPEVSLEDKVKAAYILNFIRYTVWPDESFSNSESALVVCVLNSDKVSDALSLAISGAKRFDRKVEVKNLNALSGESLKPCHVLFLPRTHARKDIDLIISLKHKSILSISDDETFFKSGGIISFVFFEKTIRFNVNLKAADEAGLKLSSRMLSLAKNVVKNKKD